jgi:hypothetical protein
MTADQPPRQNSRGHPCPDWCVTDHETVHGEAGTHDHHGGVPADIRVPGELASLPDEIGVWPLHYGLDDREAVVAVRGVRRQADYGYPYLRVSVADAGELAALVEMLAEATPEAHRELAGALRKAAADITGEDTDG